MGRSRAIPPRSTTTQEQPQSANTTQEQSHPGATPTWLPPALPFPYHTLDSSPLRVYPIRPTRTSPSFFWSLP